MSDPILGQVQMFGFNFAPKDWGKCAGQSIASSQNPALFSLLGISFGGDGRTEFSLPDLRGRTPLGQGMYQDPYGDNINYEVGNQGGFENVTLTIDEMAQHSHYFKVSRENGNFAQMKDGRTVAGESLSGGVPYNFFTNLTSSLNSLNSGIVSSFGNGLPHNNCQPSLVVGFCISLDGTYPSRN